MDIPSESPFRAVERKCAIPPDNQTPAGAAAILPFIPIGAAVLFILIANVVSTGFRLLLPYPMSPWEAGIVTDAWRMLHGGAVYAAGTDHATHMYGPLVTVFLAQVFRLTGPTLYAGRLASVISAVAVVVMLVRIFGRVDSLAAITAAALLMGPNGRTLFYYTETRPDMDALLLAALSLLLLYHGLEVPYRKPRIISILAGTALMVAAVLFKQTAAMFMLVPMLSMALGTQFSPSRWLAATFPVAGVLASLAAVRLFAPGLWHFMVQVPAQYPVPALTMWSLGLEILQGLPLFVLALTNWLFSDVRDTWRRPQVRWLVAAILCTFPACVAGYSKVGGGRNSLIPALLCMGAFCAWRAPVVFMFLRDPARPLGARIVVGAVFGLLLFEQAMPLHDWKLMFPPFRSTLSGIGIREYARTIDAARLLSGTVICPDDPFVALKAKGYAGRTGVFEADAVSWNFSRMGAVVKEINSADYVILMRRGLPGVLTTDLDWGDREHWLRSSGFNRESVGPFPSPSFELWHKASQPGPSHR
jgi:hypothetical protein